MCEIETRRFIASDKSLNAWFTVNTSSSQHYLSFYALLTRKASRVLKLMTSVLNLYQYSVTTRRKVRTQLFQLLICRGMLQILESVQLDKHFQYQILFYCKAKLGEDVSVWGGRQEEDLWKKFSWREDTSCAKFTVAARRGRVYLISDLSTLFQMLLFFFHSPCSSTKYLTPCPTLQMLSR